MNFKLTIIHKCQRLLKQADSCMKHIFQPEQLPRESKRARLYLSGKFSKTLQQQTIKYREKGKDIGTYQSI
ncbi:hypothetical protein Mapa_011620 [Marchantia paleacea]|nr:hypothetical protein Mapa_011620 [Marchantia paleacea]